MTVPAPERRRLGRVAAPLLAALPLLLLAEPPRPDPVECGRGALAAHPEAAAKAALARRAAREAGPGPSHVEGLDRGVDVLTYDVSLSVDPAREWLEGRTVIRLMAAVDGASSVPLDFAGSYELVEVLRDGRPVSPSSRTSSRLVLPLDPPLSRESRTTLEVAYRGAPPGVGALAFWGSPDGPVVTSLSEPFDARTFWPCVDDPSDRAVVTVRATVPPGVTAASGGLVTEEALPDGRRTFTWRLPQAIPTYLVALSAGRFSTVTSTYVSRDGEVEMPVVSYVLPSTLAAATTHLAAVPRHIEVLAGIFGEYPFVDTKYGIVASHFRGGMEHPTLTSIGSELLGDDSRDLTGLLVHELAHQWWGDEVTMRTWDDIWLNEGFATYAEVLYDERADGVEPGPNLAAWYDDGRYSGALGATVVADPSNPFRYTGAVYEKGAWVLHMLRRLVGDEAFFDALAVYRQRHALGNATRQELRSEVEEVSGVGLKQFFDQWLETPYRPILRVTVGNVPDASAVRVTVEQRQGHAVRHPKTADGDASWYAFPLRVRLTDASGASANVTANVSGRTATETVTVPNPLGRPVTKVVVDPSKDLLKILEAATVGG